MRGKSSYLNSVPELRVCRHPEERGSGWLREVEEGSVGAAWVRSPRVNGLDPCDSRSRHSQGEGHEGADTSSLAAIHPFSISAATGTAAGHHTALAPGLSPHLHS